MTEAKPKNGNGPAAIGRCPICKGATIVKYRPFCSRRCADVDLSHWLRGSYAIAGGNADEDDDGDDARAGDPNHFTDQETFDPSRNH